MQNALRILLVSMRADYDIPEMMLVLYHSLMIEIEKVSDVYTGCPTRYWTRHFFNNSNTNEDTVTKFEQEYVRCVKNEEECVCSVCLFCCSIFIGVRIIKEIPGSVASGTPCISFVYLQICITELRVFYHFSSCEMFICDTGWRYNCVVIPVWKIVIWVS